MKKTRSRILALMLTVCMVLTLLPGVAFAADYEAVPTLAVTAGYGDDGDQIKIGATLTATAAAGAETTTLAYEWQASADGSSGWAATASSADSATYTVAAADVGKYLRVQVTASGTDIGTVQSAATAQVPYTINLTKSGATGTDDVYFGTANTMTTYAASGSVSIGYVLNGSGTKSNGITYSGGTVTKVTTPGTSTSSYTVDPDDATSGVISLTATFDHEDLAPIYVHATKVTSENDGSFDKPYQTLAAAYAAVPTGGEIRVLSNLTVTAVTKINTVNKTVTIQSYSDATTPKTENPWTITRGFGPISSEGSSGVEDCIFYVENSHLTLKNIIIDGSKDNAAFVGGATRHIYIKGGASAGQATNSTVHLESGSVLQNGKSGMTGTAVLAGFSGSYGTLYVHDGAKIIDNDNSAASSRSNVIESQCGDVYLLGGEISGNKLANIPAAGAIVMMTEGNLHVSGNPKVADNETTAGALANVYLNERTITVDGALTSGANIGVALAVMPSATTKTKDIAVKGSSYSIQSSDVAYFHSDKATAAGVRLDGTSGTTGAKVVLDYDARVIVNTDVTIGNDGNASITIDPTMAGMYYAVLDKNGVAVVTSVTGANPATDTNSWYTADGSGEMTFGGLDPADGPYQVVTSGSNAIPPATNSGSVANGTAVGDSVEFLYVKDGGDDAHTGTKAAPFKTVNHAFTKAVANKTVVIILLSDLETPFGNDNSNAPTSAGSTAIVTSEGGPWTMYRDCTSSTSATLSVSSAGAKIKLILDNVVLNGAGDNNAVAKSGFGEVFVATGGEVVLRNGAKITNSATRGVNIHKGGVFVMEGGEISGNTAGANIMWGGDNYPGIANAGGGVYACPGGTFVMTGGTITGNTATVGAAGVFGEVGAIFKMSGTPVVTGNTQNGAASNVYLNDADSTLGGGQTITLIGNMEPGANVCVYVKNMPSAAGEKVDIATGASATDAAYFHSDKASQAGIVFDTGKVVLSYDARAQVAAKVDKDGKGQLTVTTAPGTQYFINDEDGHVPDDVKAYDKDGAEVTPDGNGWYQTNNGPLTFKPLELAKEYQVCSKTPGQPGNTAWGDGSVIEIPVVGENLYAKPGEGDKTTIVIDPADEDIKYAVLDEDGTQVFPVEPEWISGTGEKIVIELPNLNSGEKYQVVGVPKTDTTTEPVDKSDSGAIVVTPEQDIAEVGSGENDKIDRLPDDGNEGKDKIVLNPTKADQEYGVRDPITGEITWKPGTGNDTDLVFDNLDPDKDYDVVTRTPGVGPEPGPAKDPSTPSKGVTVNKNVDADNISGTYDKDADVGKEAGIVIKPTDPNLSYAVVDENGVVVGAWTPGTGGSVSFPGLKPGEDYKIVTTPTTTPMPNASEVPGGTHVVAPEKPVDAPNKDGSGTGTQAKREENPNAATDKITIPAAEATDKYKFAIQDEDGNYYKQDGSLNTPDPKVPVYVTGANADIVFDHLPMGKDYEIVKLPAAAADPVGAIQIPSVTPVPTLPPVVGEDAVTTGIEKDGDAFITVNPTDSDYNYILTDKDGKALVITGGNGGSITFPNLMPGEEYKVVTEKKDKETPTQVGETADTVRGTDVETPVLKDNAITGGKDTTNPGKTQIVIDPASDEVKYVVTDSDGKVVAVAPGTDGKLVIGGLDSNKEYTVSTVPKDAVTPAVGDTGYTPTEPNVTIKTPTTGTSDIPDAKPAITTGTGSITINPTVNGKVYEVVDPGTGLVVGTVTGDGNSITIDGLQSGKEYVVQVRDDVDTIPVILGKVTTPGGGGGSTGGSSSSSNATVNKPNGGTVTVNPKNPKPGDKVTITVKPDEGFTTDKVVVKTTPGGKEVELTDNGDGTYTYTQPKERVTIDATFKKVTGDPDSNGVSDLLNTVDHMAYLKGNDAGNFAPTTAMTRAEVAQMFYNLLKNKDTNLGNKASFSDVSAEAWYATAVNTLANIGILNGRGDGSYDPEASITRAEFVSIATRFAAKTTGSKTYTDVTADYWAAEAISAASYYGWIGGYGDGTFKPTANIARSEAVKVVNAMLGRSADKAFIDKAEGLKTFPDVPKTDWAYYPIMEATNAHDFELKDGVETWKSK